MMLKVGLTGGLASGKSTIRRMLAGLGCATEDADAIVARLYQPGEPGHVALLGAYGSDIQLPGGQIDRQKLSAIAFSNATEARKLNALIHPIVISEENRMMREAEEQSAGDDLIYVVEATLLIEAGGKGRYDRIVVIDVPPDVQIARARDRGMSEAEARRRIENQLSRDERLRHADYVIDNSGDQAAAEAETRRVHALLLADLLKKKEASGSPPEASSK